MRSEEAPALDIIKEKLKQINENIIIGRVVCIDERLVYVFYLKNDGREASVEFSYEFLTDLRDNPTAPTSDYSQRMNKKLTESLLVAIEGNGLISFNERTLKYLLLKHIYNRVKNGSHVHKYNVIRKYEKGELESSMKVTFSEPEKQILIWAWDELRRLRLIVPTGKDLINPDDWVTITEKGIAAVENISYVEFIEGEHFINKGEVFDAYQKIISIMQQAKKELRIIDSYIDTDILNMIDSLEPEIKVRIISDTMKGDFDLALKKLQKQRGNIEVKKSNHFHDRFIIIDDQVCYHLGASIKDAGNKATMIDKKEDDTKNRVIQEFEKIWKS